MNKRAKSPSRPETGFRNETRPPIASPLTEAIGALQSPVDGRDVAVGRVHDLVDGGLRRTATGTLIGQNMTHKRINIKVPGLEHMNPIPLATRVGSLLVTGAIPGKDPETGQTGTDLKNQCALMFANIPRIMEAAGGSIDDIVKLAVWLKGNDKTHLNKEWLLMFPKHESQPARQTFQNQDLPQDYLVQCEITAVMEDQ